MYLVLKINTTLQKKRMDKVKDFYKNDTTLSTAINELSCGVGKLLLEKR